MRLEEFDEFKAELKQLCATLGKAYTDALAQAYWRALKDASLDEIQACVERILFNCTRETKFPKPHELRITPSKQTGELPEQALKLNEASWREKFARNRPLAQIELTWCQYQLVIASSREDSPEHAMALESALAIERRHGNPRFFDYGA